MDGSKNRNQGQWQVMNGGKWELLGRHPELLLYCCSLPTFPSSRLLSRLGLSTTCHCLSCTPFADIGLAELTEPSVPHALSFTDLWFQYWDGPDLGWLPSGLSSSSKLVKARPCVCRVFFLCMQEPGWWRWLLFPWEDIMSTRLLTRKAIFNLRRGREVCTHSYHREKWALDNT